jgi:flagella basal body P-ring formation protein FlgA
MKIWISLWLCLIAQSSMAEETLSAMASILQAAETYAYASVDQRLYSRIEVKISHLDPRIKIHPCPSAALSFSQISKNGPSYGRMTLMAQCQEPYWKLYLPIELLVYRPVLTLSRAMSAGEYIQAQDLTLVETELSTVRESYFESFEHVVGRILKTSLPSGSVISPRMIEPLKVIKRGDVVSLVIKNARISVSMRGRALMDATLGHRVSVENLSSKRIVEGIASAVGIVEIITP